MLEIYLTFYLVVVPPLGVEPSSEVLQTPAMTTSAKAALFGSPYPGRTDDLRLVRALLYL